MNSHTRGGRAQSDRRIWQICPYNSYKLMTARSGCVFGLLRSVFRSCLHFISLVVKVFYSRKRHNNSKMHQDTTYKRRYHPVYNVSTNTNGRQYIL